MTKNNAKYGNGDLLMKTEELTSETNFDFANFVSFEYYFEIQQNIHFEITLDGQTAVLNTTVSRIMGSKNQTVELTFDENEEGYGNFAAKMISKKLVIKGTTEEKGKVRKEFNFDLSLEMSVNGTYYYVISGLIGDKLRGIYKSEHMKGKKLQFKRFTSYLEEVCSNRTNAQFKVEIFNDFEQLLGVIDSTIDEISKNRQFIVRDEDTGETTGQCVISIETFDSQRFLDYIQSGLEICLVIGIDYTVSNKEPSNPDSLHYMNFNQQSQYEKAIRACASIVGHYDSDQLFPVFGFGGNPNNGQEVSHCFPINFSNNPNIYGVEGILDVYKKSIGNIGFSSPTFFTPLIETTVKQIQLDLSNGITNYYILMIITDGIINDIQNTIDIIVYASKLPLSIIIIGVGNANFDSMNELDGDNKPLVDSNKLRTHRDIVQFVKFSDFAFDGNALAEEVLKEVPSQVESYFSKFGKFKGKVY